MEGGSNPGYQSFPMSISAGVLTSVASSSSKAPLRPISPRGKLVSPPTAVVTTMAINEGNCSDNKNRNKMVIDDDKINNIGAKGTPVGATTWRGVTEEVGGQRDQVGREQDLYLPIANVIRIMRRVLPAYAKISEEAKETMQECVSEYISFITGEANERCQQEQRKTITSMDLLWAMSKLGFDDYIEPLTLNMQRYRELEGKNHNSLYKDSLPPIKHTAFDANLYGSLSNHIGVEQGHYHLPHHQPHPYLQQPAFFLNEGGTNPVVSGPGLLPGWEGRITPVDYYNEALANFDMPTYRDAPSTYCNVSLYHDVPDFRDVPTCGDVEGGHKGVTDPSSSYQVGQSQEPFLGFDPYAPYK